VKLSSFQ